jgi:hypothetical protein
MISATEFKNRVRAAGDFNVGWVKFSVKFKSEVNHGGDDCLGLTSFDDLEIIVKDVKNVISMRLALLHECWHALLSTVGVKNPDEDETVPLGITNEFITEQCARASIIAPSFNPELWELLTNEEYYE